MCYKVVLFDDRLRMISECVTIWYCLMTYLRWEVNVLQGGIV